MGFSLLVPQVKNELWVVYFYSRFYYHKRLSLTDSLFSAAIYALHAVEFLKVTPVWFMANVSCFLY